MRRLILLALALVSVAPLAAQQRTRSPHGDLKLECKACHRADGWKPAQISKSFDHARYGFALKGAHVTTACRACHQSLDFKGAKSDCLSCHADKHQGELGTNCARCHTVRSFLDREVMTKAHQLTRFPLAGAHQAIDCAACHKPAPQGGMQFVSTSSECVTCHTTDFNNAPKHRTAADQIANFQTCSGCHLSAVTWGGAGLTRGNHPTTPIDPNAAGHASLTCDQCHTGQPYTAQNAAQTCNGCHNSQFVATTAPRHSDAGFATTCEQCHSQTSLAWTTSSWQHPSTPFNTRSSPPHAAATCTQCHVSAPYKNVATTCYGCHKADYDTKAPNHKTGAFNQDCTKCHSATAWTPNTFNHATTTSIVQLTGVHASPAPVACTDCHRSGPFASTVNTCYGCHTTDYNNASTIDPTAPNHVTGAYDHNCLSCHTLAPGWKGAQAYNHQTPIALTGPHAGRQCLDCHLGGDYSSKWQSATCYTCHQANFTSAPTPQPSHVTGALSQTCTQCHSVNSMTWAPSQFQHPTAPFQLQGQHALALRACADCHTGTYASSQSKTTCVACHQSVYDLTGWPTSPPHKTGGMSTTCTQCHSATAAGWTPSTFNHGTTVSIVKLTDPVHSLATCQQCHTNGQTFASAQNTCYGCHSTDYVNANKVNTSAPDHVTGNFDHNCLSCHTLTPGWTGATAYNHQTPIALTGPHAGRQCLDCHIGGDYSSKWQSATCYTCHQANFTSAPTPQPSHVTGALSQTCTQCHSVNSMTWTPSQFVHPSAPFQLAGQHALALRACADCHTGTYASAQTKTTCIDCHQTVYNLTGWPASPPHKTGGLSTTCTQCHSVTAPSWTPSSFSHGATVSIVKLTDPVHSLATCQQCHVNGQTFASAQNTCYGCHSTDYVNANKIDPAAPDHVVGGYSQDCTSCHPMQAGWLGATFTHLQAPFALVGQHAVNVRQCTDCHVGTATHSNWPPQTCDGCHGPGAPAPFLNTYGATVNPPHAANPSSFPIASCSQCHTVSGPDWTGAARSKFNHATTGWALTGPHAAFTLDCNNTMCHGSNNNYHLTTQIGSPTSATFCYNCHRNDYTGAVNPPHTAATGFGTDCTTCHTASPVDWHTPQATYATHKTTPILMNGQHSMSLRTCADCHTTTPYSTVPTTCAGCHQATWASATDPNHNATGMTAFAAANCTNCHSQSLAVWTPATWTHPTGKPHGFKRTHHGAKDCSQCHVNTGDYTVSDCQSCHRQSSMDSKHRGENGYVPGNTIQCATCHDGN